MKIEILKEEIKGKAIQKVKTKHQKNEKQTECHCQTALGLLFKRMDAWIFKA